MYSVVSLLGQTPCKELVTALLERWRPETNTFHLLQGEATITLEDVEVLTGLLTRGRPVSVGYDDRAADVICQELLDATPPPTRFHGHQVKISWVKEQFDRLPAGAPADVITCYARAYTWVLLGAILLADRSGDLIPVHLLRLLSDFAVKGTGDIGGFTLLVQLWALERFSYIADRYIAGGDLPADDSYPRGMRWMPIVHRHQHRVSMKLEEIRYALDRSTKFVVRILIRLLLIYLIFLIGRKNILVIFSLLNFLWLPYASRELAY
ncbi:Serine/threonine-protein phosphatase 7 long form homolog [Linum perenne]